MGYLIIYSGDNYGVQNIRTGQLVLKISLYGVYSGNKSFHYSMSNKNSCMICDVNYPYI